MTRAQSGEGWEILHIGLCAHDPEAAAAFYRDVVGLSKFDTGGACPSCSNGLQGLSLYRPEPAFAAERKFLHNPRMTKLAVLGVEDPEGVRKKLDAASVPWSEIDGLVPGLDPLLVCHDPSMNLIGFAAWDGAPAPRADWFLHHVNLQAHDVRETVRFFTEIVGMTEGQWQAPAEKGDFSIDPNELAVLKLGGENRGLHVIRPDAGFGLRNGFAHNPSVGGHPAFCVPDIHAVMARLDAAGTVYSDAGTYAMTGYHQVYVYDPSFNLIEINQRLGPS